MDNKKYDPQNYDESGYIRRW